MLNQDTDRTQAVHISHISHRWLRWLDAKVAQLKAENGGYFDIYALFRGQDAPYETGVNGKYRDQQIVSERIEQEG